MRKIRIAQIGIGHDHASEIFTRLKRLSDTFEIAGYALPPEEKARYADRLSVFDGYPELTVDEILHSDIEAVTVETEELNLTKYALLMAEGKKHMHMDKPGGLALDEFEKLIEAVKTNGAVFHLGYMYRYNPYVRELLAKVKSGELGEIFSVQAQMDCCHPEWKRQWLEQFPGGIMFFLGCHLVDLILQIQGMPDKVIPILKSTKYGGVTANDYAIAVMEYPNGVSWAKSCAAEVGGFARRKIVVCGSRGSVELCPMEMNVYQDGKFVGQYVEKTEYFSRDWCDMGVAARSDIHDRYSAMMESFAAMVRGEKENPYSCDYELTLYKLVLQCCGML